MMQTNNTSDNTVGGIDFLEASAMQSPIIPVITIQHPDDAVPMAEALVRGGLTMLEITLRTPFGVGAIRDIKAKVPDAIVGVGTVISAQQVSEVKAAGAEFIVTPGTTPTLLKALIASNVPFLPGVSTLSEILQCYEHGVRRFKFFPAEVSGGISALKAFSGPMGDIRFCPTGGIRPDNVADYLAQNNVMAVGGTWLTPDKIVAEKRWDELTALAEAAIAACR